ncbi:hypothetical protein RhiirA5_349650 [Rhizophagus irregularis]|uniref:Uncharacterized protein n=2 Tax=Rhizophagus irregularis TaxID=588596 RepID=A0A2N0Q7E6_9GLOM|nr:hypothetical protein RhiirA5_349650 [Rhizophagus irregularis]GET65363.1 hypothetical protein RIR_jg5358.t1 [Rhizophagus irregularis DAOM 181602=DAOM 197198]
MSRSSYCPWNRYQKTIRLYKADVLLIFAEKINTRVSVAHSTVFCFCFIRRILGIWRNIVSNFYYTNSWVQEKAGFYILF